MRGAGAGPTILPEGGCDFAAVTARLRAVTVQVYCGRNGVGSGVVWTSGGLIVTNAHVAHGRLARVVLPTGHAVEARLLVRDGDSDLAALATNTGGLIAADIGDSDALRVGELVVAVGSPFGLPGAVTAGVIHAAPSRRRGGPSFIEADVRLAPGNSGGPLADSCGRVIGINARIAGGLALAVPSNVVAGFLASVP